MREISNTVLKSLVRVLIWGVRVPVLLYALILFVGMVSLVGALVLGREVACFVYNHSPIKPTSKS